MVMGIALSIFGIALIIAVMILRKRKIRGAASLIIFSFALITWACAYGVLVYRTIHDPQSDQRFWLALITLSATVTATALLAFILSYTSHQEWLSKWGILLLCLEPLVTQALFWTTPWHGFFSTTYMLTTSGVFLNPSPWIWINAAYSDGLMILALILLTQTFLNKPRQYLLQSITVIIAVFIPILIKIASLAVFVLILNLEPPLVSFIITGGFLVYTIYRFELMDIATISRNLVIESMSDGWMVLDLNNRIVDLNSATESLLGVTRDQTFGKPAEIILQNLIDLDQKPSNREVETRGSVKLQNGWRYLNVRILPLHHPPERQIGKVILWRDITDRRKSDDARQRAREEMFVLLHTISDTAFRTSSQNEFLTDSISQIVYSFYSQAGLIFLLEESGSNPDVPKVFLAAHHGIARNDLVHLQSSPGVARVLIQILEQKEPLLVPDVSTDPGLPPSMQQSGNQSILMYPLIAGEQVLGVIGLVRKDGSPAFGNGEVTRLGVIAEELASFIRSDRSRQQAIAQEERQSLVRDLHDSIAQKLYGLVALTEAAQASLETGKPVQEAEISRIGENARQALKEMRLFLFQMKPVDLQTKGLVGALNERLAAVEGRANIKARVLADENINLSLEKETILYNIALEALNNIIKHANARAVTILLKKRKTSVTLEVADDGSGFDQSMPGNGGMGLRFMQERISKVDGKVEIKSAPGKGTKVIATVDENKISHATRKTKKNNE